LGAVAIITSIVGIFFIRLGKSNNIMNALYKGLAVAGGLAAIIFYPVTRLLMPENALNLYFASLIGLAVAALMVLITEYYTSTNISRSAQLPRLRNPGTAPMLLPA